MSDTPKRLRNILPAPNDPVEAARHLLLTSDLRLVPPPNPFAIYGNLPLLDVEMVSPGQPPDETAIARIAEMAGRFVTPPVLAVAVNPEDAEGVEFPPPGTFGGPAYHINPLVARGKLWATRDPLYAKLFDHATLLRLMGGMAGDFARMMNGLGEDKHGEHGGDGGGGAGGGTDE